MKIKFLLLTGVAFVCLMVGLSLRPTSTVASAQMGTICVQGTAPLVTHGLTPIPPLLPNGDQFLLANGLLFVAANAPAGSTAGTVTAANFGGLPNTAGNFGFTGTNVPFFANSTAGSTLRAVSCVDNLWDINFAIASAGSTSGDIVRVSIQGAGGTTTLAEFTANGTGVTLGNRNIGVTVFNNNILANTATLDNGAFIGFTQGAGTAGSRTNQITIALSASTMGCSRVIFEIIRPSGAGTGTTSVAIASVVVTRSNTSTANGTGLLTQFGGGQAGTYPTGITCNADCPTACPPPPVGNLMCPFMMMCFHTPGYYCAANIPYAATTVRIPQVNFGYPVSVRTGGGVSSVVNRYLGCYQYLFESNSSPQRILTKYYMAAQFTIDSYDSTSSIVNLSENVSVGCYLMPAMAGQPPVLPVTLSNGVTISADTKFCILFRETESAIIQMRMADIDALTKIYKALTTCEGRD